MRKMVLILITWIMVFGSVVHADDKSAKTLDRAYMNALDKHYKEAIDQTSQLLDSLTLNRIEDISLAHQILTISYCELGDQEQSLSHLKAMRAFSPNQDFRVFNPSANCLKILAPEVTRDSRIKKMKVH